MFAFEPPQRQNQSSHLVSSAAGQRVARLFPEAGYSPDLEPSIGNQAMKLLLNQYGIGSGGPDVGQDVSVPAAQPPVHVKAGPIGGVPESVPDASVLPPTSSSTPAPTVLPTVSNQVGLTVKTQEPIPCSRPSAEISAQHGRPDIMAWTTPNVDITKIEVYPDDNIVNVSISLAWSIDMPAEYAHSPRYAILLDHEKGHAEIGKKVAQDVFGISMRGELITTAPLTQDSILAVVRKFVSIFLVEEHKESLAYDVRDYPRLQQAYIGASMSLSDLMCQSWTIMQLVIWLDALNSELDKLPVAGSPQSPENGFDELPTGLYAVEVVNATDALGAQDIARIQYNREFKNKVASAQVGCTLYREAFESEECLDNLGAFGQMVDELEATLKEFIFSAL